MPPSQFRFITMAPPATEPKKLRILLADDHVITRMGLSMLFSSEPDMEIVGEADNGEVAVRLSRKFQPDIVVMDLLMPVMNGADATKHVLKGSPAAKVVILTTFGNAEELSAAVKNGASAILLKDTPTRSLVAALRKVHAGETIITPSIRTQTKDDANTPNLTERQQEIVHSLTRGLSNADIAKQLGISAFGVQKHLKLIFAKLGAATRAEAAAIALRKHLLKI